MMYSTSLVTLQVIICVSQYTVSVAILSDDFLLVTDSAAGAIYQIGRDGGHVTELDLNVASQVPVAVDYDPDNGLMYWTDINSHAIRTSKLDGSDSKILVQMSTKSSPEGVAVDPVAGLVFFTDQGENTISIVKADGTDRKTLIQNVQNPRTVRLDPRQRYIYWADWGSNTIERASYDGSNRKVLYKTGASWINGIELDLNSRHLYWVDAYSDLLQMMDMDTGDDVATVLDGNATDVEGTNSTINPHFYGISLDDEYIYITDWDRKGVFSIRKDGSDFTLLHGPLLVASGVLAYRSSWYTHGHQSHCNDALDRNAGCSNLCIPTSESIVCACPDNQRLSPDDRNCLSDVVALGPDVIWLEHDKLSTSYIMGMHGDPSVYLGQRKFGERWSIRSPLWHWTAVDNDYRRNKLYMADREDNLIVQLSMTSNLTMDVVHFGTSSKVNGIAMDWVGRNVYWTDSLFNWIMMAKAVHKTPVSRTVISSELEEPHGITVWPQKGMLLWTDWGGSNKIEMSTLSGTDRRILVDSDLNSPTGITIDYMQEKIYWCNRDSIEEMRADGGGRRRLATQPSAHYVALTHFDKFIFATDRNSASSSYKLWIFNAANPEATYPRLLLQRAPYGITMLSKAKQEHTTNVCNEASCAQLCVVQADQTALCLCGDGYDLDPDAKSCRENNKTFTGPSIIYSLGDRLCSVTTQKAMGFVNNPDLNCFFADPRYSFRALDYHYATGNIYFSEVKYRVRSIRMAHMKNITDNTAVVQGTGEIKGIAVDYTAGNLYWTDYTYGQIWVSRLDGSLQKILLTGLLQPAGIAIDQMNKKMYWSEQGNDTDEENIIPGSLKYADLDGNNMVTLEIEGVQKPAGVSLDPLSGRLLWVDQAKATIEYIRPGNLEDHGTVALPKDASDQNVGKLLYDVAVFQDFYVYSQWGPNNRSGVHVVESESKNELNSNLLHRLHDTAYDVIVFSHQYQANMYPGNPGESCVYDNGDCEQLCLQNPNGRTCACIDGMVPDHKDTTKCVPSVLRKDNFFLIADDYRYQIYQSGSDMSDDVISAIAMPPGDRPIALAYDFKDERIYWTDFHAGVIKRSYLNGTAAEVIYVGGVSSRIDGLAFDEESRVLYYTDTGLGYIGVLSPSGTYHKVIVKEDLTNPRAIVLDTKMGYMYYTVRETSNGRIERRDLTGRNPVVLINTSLSWPNGLDIDFLAGLMYWVDAHSETIESADLSGSARTVIHTGSKASDPFGLAVQGDYVYWTDWSFRGVFRVPRQGGDATVQNGDMFRGLNDIKFFNRSALRGANACSYGKAGCSHFCLSGPGDTRSCDCPSGYKLHTDESTCVDVPTCPQEVPNGQIEAGCSREFDVKCSFGCTNGYTKTTQRGIRCGEDLTWEADIDTLCAYDVCPLLTNPEHALADPHCPLVGTPGTSCVYECDFGYIQAGGDMERRCLSNNTWSGRDITCIPVIRCPPLNVTADVVVYPQSCVENSAIPGQSCQQRCKPGMVQDPAYVSGSELWVCLEGSVWNGTVLHCISATSIVAPVTNKPKLTTPIIIGIAIACVALVLIIILISVLLVRKHSKKFARYRDSSNIPQTRVDSTPSNGFHYGQEVNGNSPTYDARTDSVDLAFSSFEDHTYSKLDSLGGASVSDVSSLPRKQPIDADARGADAHDIEAVEFDNPMYTKEQQNKATIREVDSVLQGNMVQPDLTRELSSA